MGLIMKSDPGTRSWLLSAATIPLLSLMMTGCAGTIADFFEGPGVDEADNVREPVVVEPVKINTEIITTGATPPVPPLDRNARSEFRVEDIVAHQYLVVTVEIKADSITLKKAGLVRGPEKANSVVDDLRIRTYKGAELVTEYSIADPRFLRRQAGHGMTQGHEWTVSVDALKRIYIELRADIDLVEIAPAPGSRAGVSLGGSFNPRAIAALACQIDETDRFPACDDFPDGSWEQIPD